MNKDDSGPTPPVCPREADDADFIHHIDGGNHHHLVILVRRFAGRQLPVLPDPIAAIGYIGYIGHTVEAEGDTTALQDGEVSWEYDLDSDAKTVVLTVRDADGSVVYRQTGDSSTGTHPFTWDGVGTDGTVHTDGSFTLSVDAVDTANATVSTTTRIKAVVNAVDTSSSATVLDLDSGVTITADAALSVS